MKHTSILIDKPCELINITPMNPLISRCYIKVLYIGENRNGSSISREVAMQIANSLPGSPIVGFFNEATEDFEEHNRRIDIVGGVLKFSETTKSYGFVDLGAKAWFQDYLDDGVVHTYLVTEGYLWTGQFPEAKRVIEQGNNQSMELDENSLQGTWTTKDNSDVEIFIINEAIISKLCILGEDFEPCFEGASIGKFSLDKDFHQRIYSLMKEVQKLKGGELSLMDEKIKEIEEQENAVTPVEEPEAPAIEFSATSVEADATQVPQEAPVVAEEEQHEEAILPEDNSLQFSLEDFQELQENYSALETRFNELQEKYNSMETNYNSLVEFKQTKDREEKQQMIDSFYMLSDEDKKDVQDNIDKYSLDEIESKLSVICVHNKVDLSGEHKEDVPDTSFSLIDTDGMGEEENIPAWVSSLRQTKKNNN